MRFIDCLVVEHDLSLVALAAAVCLAGIATAMMVFDRATKGESKNLWLALLTICFGSTVWATHFLAMLAYQVSVPMTYAPGLTMVSYAVGTAIIGAGLWLALRRRAGAGGAALGGAIIGAGVSILHYIGMAALSVPGEMHFGAGWIVLSTALSSLFGAAGLALICVGQTAKARTWGATLLVLMIVSLHFVGMSAIELRLNASEAPEAGISRSALVVAVTLAVLAVLAIAAAGLLLDKRFTKRLTDEADRFRTLANGAFEGLLIYDAGVIVEANSAARRLLDLDDAKGREEAVSWLRSLAQPAALSDGVPAEMRAPGVQGVAFSAEVSRSAIRLANGGMGQLFAVRDLTARKLAEAKISHLALHDPLTELPNRRLFMELLNKSVAYAQRSGDRFAVLSIDLDGFKQVNDMYGHAAGDTLLKTVATRIGNGLRDADALARFGGDEFVILQSALTTPSHAVAIADRILERLTLPIAIESAEVTVSASIGIAIYPDDGLSSEDLLRNADTAMYRAKADGKATYRFFESQMDAVLEKRRLLEAKLRSALIEGRLDVAFQPLVRSSSQKILGFEALVRWNDPELGSVAPSDFIPVAEETGLIIALGEFVMQRACREATQWPGNLRVSVNLSAVQFRRRGLVAMVERSLAATGLSGDRLELEVTESILIDNRDDALNTLTALKALGVKIAMDDFGTGYSSLSYLQSFPFDTIKIDKAFVSGMEANSQSASIVKAVTAMGKGLQMRVVAEGVETAHQAQMLRDFECDEIQGYLIAKPLPPHQIDDFLKDNGLLPADAAAGDRVNEAVEA